MPSPVNWAEDAVAMHKQYASVREPAIAHILHHGGYGSALNGVERLVAAYDILLNYAKAISLGDTCPNPLDGKLDKRPYG